MVGGRKLGCFHSRHVERIGERRTHAHGSVEDTRIVIRRVFRHGGVSGRKTGGGVHHDRAGIPATLERGRIDDRLDRRSRLQLRRRVIDLAADHRIIEVGAPDHEEDLAAPGHDTNGRAIVPVEDREICHTVGDDLLGPGLQIDIDTRVEIQSAVIERVFAVVLNDPAFDIFGEMRRVLNAAARLILDRQRFSERGIGLRSGDVVVLHHLVQHVLLPNLRLIEEDGRIVR